VDRKEAVKLNAQITEENFGNITETGCRHLYLSNILKWKCHLISWPRGNIDCEKSKAYLFQHNEEQVVDICCGLFQTLLDKIQHGWEKPDIPVLHVQNSRVAWNPVFFTRLAALSRSFQSATIEQQHLF